MALPHSRVLIHQPLGGAQGQATDIEIQAAEILRIKKSLNEILASNTGQSIKKIEKDTDRDYIMTPAEALEYGMIDKVVDELLVGYNEDTPIAVVKKATWNDQEIIRGTLKDIAQKVKDANITKTAMIVVGDVLNPGDFTPSKLYDPNFKHEYR